MASPELLKAAERCMYSSWITNRYTGKRIEVPCGQCEYCLTKKAQKASLRVKTAGSSFKYCFFVTLTYDNKHIPLVECNVIEHSFDTVVGISGDRIFSCEEHNRYTLAQALRCKEKFPSLAHIEFSQVQGTIPFNRKTGEYESVEGSWYMSLDSLDMLYQKTHDGNEWFEDGKCYLPFLNYCDVQNYIKRLRINLQRSNCDESISFYAVGEYGPVHFRPHYHILLFGNSASFAENVRECHVKSWKLGRSDIQLSRGQGSHSYVASYISSLAATPQLYRACKVFKPKSRASNGFYEKVEVSCDGLDEDEYLSKKIDALFNGRPFSVGEVFVCSTPPLSYIRTLLPRFTSCGKDDFVAAARLISDCATTEKRLAKYGFTTGYKSVSSLSRLYADCVFEMPFYRLQDSDINVLHECRSLTRLYQSASSVDMDYRFGCVYRLFLRVDKFLKAWGLDREDEQLFFKVQKILKRGYASESEHEYQNLVYAYQVEEVNPDFKGVIFHLPQQCEKDEIHKAAYTIDKDGNEVLTKVGQLFRDLQVKFNQRSRDMVKHKKLNDANKVFNNLI